MKLWAAHLVPLLCSRNRLWLQRDCRRARGGNHGKSGILTVSVPLNPPIRDNSIDVDDLVPTLTSSNGALPTQTTAPLTAPAKKLVIPMSLALSPENHPSCMLIQGVFRLLPSLLLGRASSVGLWSTLGGSLGKGVELRIRLVEL